MLTRKIAVLAKMEASYGVDPTPSGAANAILISGDATVTPMDMKTVSRDIFRPYFGNAEQLPTGIFSRVNFKTEMAGSGTAGVAPAWGPLLRACAFSETITAATQVEYAPVTDDLESCTLYVNRDGVLHKLSGARGSVKLDFTLDGIPAFDFSFLGLFSPVADAAMPAVSFVNWIKPLPVNRSNTVLALHGYAAKTQSLSIDMVGALSHKAFINDTESIEMTDRKPAGKIAMEATRLAQKDWWASISAAATGPLQLTQGTTAGNKVKIDAPAVQVSTPTYADHNGTLMLNGDLIFAPGSGNDEIIITAF